MNTMKNSASAGLCPGRGCWSGPTAAIAANIVLTHSSVVLICHSVKVAIRMLS
jgi:hypothetical protein